MLTNPLQRARSYAHMTAVSCDFAEFNPPHHAIRQREKSGLVSFCRETPEFVLRRAGSPIELG
jgi:hypothetical protein